MAVQLRNLPSIMVYLKYQLGEDTDIAITIDDLRRRSEEVVQSYNSAFEREGNHLLTKKQELVQVLRSSDVETENFQKAVDDFLLVLSKALNKMKSLEHSVHSGIKDCSKRKHELDQSVKVEGKNVLKINQQIRYFENRMGQKLKQAENYDRQATNCKAKARNQRNKSNKTVKQGLSGGILGAGVGIALAPLSVGASVLASSTASTWTATAKQYDRYAQNEREGAEEARKAIFSLKDRKTTCETELADSYSKIRALQTTQNSLGQIESCLRSIIQLVNQVETHVQDFDSYMHGTAVRGEIFTIIKQALSDYPLDEDLAGEAYNLMMELRSKWRVLEEEIVNTTSTV